MTAADGQAMAPLGIALKANQQLLQLKLSYNALGDEGDPLKLCCDAIHSGVSRRATAMQRPQMERMPHPAGSGACCCCCLMPAVACNHIHTNRSNVGRAVGLCLLWLETRPSPHTHLLQVNCYFSGDGLVAISESCICNHYSALQIIDVKGNHDMTTDRKVPS